jgi:methyl-accepting chemotaxis protein
MKLLGKLRLSHQILFILLLIPSFSTFSLLYYSALQHINIRNKPLEQMALSTSSSASEKINRNINECYRDVQAFAYNKLAVTALQNNVSDSSLQKFINTMTCYYDSYDLMMLCDITGKVIAVNTKDKNKNTISSDFLINKNMNEEEWFRSSIAIGGPKGGAYYSDFNEDETVGQLYNTKGYGIDFSAPVHDEAGAIIGVWRNRASWNKITQEIRKEAEISLQKEVKGAIILLMDKQGHLIDADNEANILKVTIGKNNLFKTFNFNYAGIDINEDDYIYGWSISKDSHGGNKWNFLTLIPKVKITDYSIYIHSDWTTLMLFSISLLLIGIVISLFFVNHFSKRMNSIKNSVLQLSKGKTELIENTKYKDEIGEMSLALNTLNLNFKNIATFSNEIGKGNLSASYQLLGEEDLLGLSLLKMQENLTSIESENNKQKWTSEKLAALGELLRAQDDATIKFTKLISFISKAVSAYQSALFIIDYKAHPHTIKLRSGYALTAERMNMPPFYWGENAIGQCIKDNEIIRLNNLPEDYSTLINSGLGAIIPNDIIIVPITFNNNVEGALEFSSFNPLEKYKVEFLKKTAEYIGSFIVQIRVNEQIENTNLSEL